MYIIRAVISLREREETRELKLVKPFHYMLPSAMLL